MAQLFSSKAKYSYCFHFYVFLFLRVWINNISLLYITNHFYVTRNPGYLVGNINGNELNAYVY